MAPPFQTIDDEVIKEMQTGNVSPQTKLRLSAPKFLLMLGGNIRRLRTERKITRKQLAQSSATSERFLAALETGTGNASVLVLRKIATALRVALETLFAEEATQPTELGRVVALLGGLDEAELLQVHHVLIEHLAFKGPVDREQRKQRIALIGLRGAGKSTLGALAAKARGVPFIELDKLVEKASGVPLEMVFELYGQSGFRRYERECLEDVLKNEKQFVLATSGSIVSDVSVGSAYSTLLRECFTVWLKASPAEHMQRVVEQGDMRPMAKNPQAMQDLERLLAERESAYRRADVTVDTSGETVENTLQKLMDTSTGVAERKPEMVEEENAVIQDPLRNFTMRPRSRLRPREI